MNKVIEEICRVCKKKFIKNSKIRNGIDSKRRPSKCVTCSRACSIKYNRSKNDYRKLY